MDDNNTRRFGRATRVKTFGETYAADFAPGSKATSLFLELNPVVVRLNDATVGQLCAPVGKPELIAALSADFVEDLRADRTASTPATPTSTATTSKACKAPPRHRHLHPLRCLPRDDRQFHRPLAPRHPLAPLDLIPQAKGRDSGM